MDRDDDGCDPSARVALHRVHVRRPLHAHLHRLPAGGPHRVRTAEGRPRVAHAHRRRPVRLRDGAPLRGVHLGDLAMAALARRLRGQGARQLQPSLLQDALQGSHRILVRVPARGRAVQDPKRRAPGGRRTVPWRLPPRRDAAARPVARMARLGRRGPTAAGQAHPRQPHGPSLWWQGGGLHACHRQRLAPLLRRLGAVHAGRAVLPAADRRARQRALRRRRPPRCQRRRQRPPDGAPFQIPLGPARGVPAGVGRPAAPLLPPRGMRARAKPSQ